MCNGGSAQCPTSEPKANFTACHGETQVCLNGVREPQGPSHPGEPAVRAATALRNLQSELGLCLCPSLSPPSPPHSLTTQGCSGSICEKYGLEACTCASQDGKDETELCHVCCMEKSESSFADSPFAFQQSKLQPYHNTIDLLSPQ